MITANDIKTLIINMGADLCGIALPERFEGAPDGFHPRDIYSDCRSVIVFLKRLPPDVLYASSCIPYTHVNDLITRQVDDLTLAISLKLTEIGIGNVLIPSDDPYEYWEPDRLYGRAILSLRHAGYLAGLGLLGKNTLLINKQYGNMIQLGAILVDTKLKQDPLAEYQTCPDKCSLCLDSCPAGALDGITVDQQACRPISIVTNSKGYKIKGCYQCRYTCPLSTGIPD